MPSCFSGWPKGESVVPGFNSNTFCRTSKRSTNAPHAVSWLSAREFDYVVVPFDRIFEAVRSGRADVGLIIHEGQLTYEKEGLEVCEDLGVWWGKENDGLPLPLGGNVIHKRFEPADRKRVSD